MGKRDKLLFNLKVKAINNIHCTHLFYFSLKFCANMTSNIPLIVRLLASSVSVANRAGKIVRDVMSKGELGIVEKV